MKYRLLGRDFRVSAIGLGCSGMSADYGVPDDVESIATIHRAADAQEWWILFSPQPGGRARVREYRKRSRVEATFADGKRRG